MVAATQESTSAAVRARNTRQRDEELLVWPDLVFIEFVAATLFTFTFTVLSLLVNAPLLDRANASVTPNPSKAPWYFLNLQELLLHMHPALAGVIVPTVALVALGAIPYFDRSNEGQGQWLSTPHAWALNWWGALVGFVGTSLLVVWDSAKHVRLWSMITGQPEKDWPVKWLANARGLQNDLPWPEWSKSIPLGNVLRTDLLGLPPLKLNLNVPEILVSQVLPVGLMIGLPLLMSYVFHRIGMAKTRRDHMILQFSGFISTYLTLTIYGTMFRGQGMDLLPPWEVIFIIA